MENYRKPGGLEKFRSTDREECGVIVEREENLFLLRLPNRAAHDDDYVILQSDLDNIVEVLSPDEKVVGFFHTHLGHHPCEPSDADFDGANLFPEMHNLIYKPSTGELCWYGGGTDEVISEKT